MRKLMMFIGIISLSIILVGCNGGEEVKTPPSFVSVTVDGSDPVSDGNLVPFYKSKQESTTITIEMTNPDNVEVTAIVINGYNYLASRFTETSTSTVKTFTMSAGTTLGERTYSVDEIVYMDGDTSKSARNFTSNEFQLYVYKDTPTAERENYQLFRDSISIDFEIDDPDDVIQTGTLKAQLFSGETLEEEQLISDGLVTVLFENLLANKQYEIKVEATYDIDDNNGIQSNVVMYSGTFQTLSNALPSALIQNIEVNSNNMTLDVEFTDDNDVVVAAGLSVGVFLDDTLVEEKTITGSTTDIAFNNLLNDTEYVIKVLADYDLRDGAGVLEDNVIALGSFSTLPREVPLPTLENLDVSENKIDFDIVINDPTGIIDKDSLVATLYFEDTEIDSADLDEYFVGFNVNNVFANYEFTIKIFGDYNLNNGDGLQVNQEIYSETFSTLEKAIPNIVVNSTNVTQGYVTMNLEVNDSNEALLGALEATLYEEGTPVQTITFNANATQIVFDYATVYTNLYAIEIKGDYNLSDGTPAQIDALLYKEVLLTLQKKAPIAEITNITSTTNQITFDVEVIDADATIDPGSTKLYVYLEGVLVDTIDLSTGTNNVIVNPLLSNNQYDLIIESDYDLDDSSGLLLEQNLYETSYNTLPKSLPTAVFEPNDITTTTETIEIDVEIIDTDSVILDATIFAELYLDGTLVESMALDNGENFNEEFTTNPLLSNTEYVIKIIADYDLDDGNAAVTEYLLAELSVTTDAKEAPSATFNFLDADKESITVDIVIGDTDDVITGNVVAQLMLGDTEITTEALLDTAAVQNITFTNLDSNARYYINILADYDLKDNETIETGATIYSDLITTDAYNTPAAAISNTVPGTDNIVFDVLVSDEDSVITGNLRAALYQGETLITTTTISTGSNTGVTFDGLTSDTSYQIRVLADYDLNETSGPITGNDGLLDAEDTATEPIDVVIIESETIDKTSNTVEVSINDVEDVLSSNYLIATLYEGAQSKATYIVSKQTNTFIDMYNLLSDFEYTLVIEGEYDSNPGTYETIYTHTFTTDAMVLPTVDIDHIDDWGTNPISFDVTIGLDEDNVVNDTSYEVVLFQDGIEVDSVDLDVLHGSNPEEDTITVTFAGYDATDGSAYTVIIRALVDLNDVDDEGEVLTDIGARTFINGQDAS